MIKESYFEISTSRGKIRGTCHIPEPDKNRNCAVVLIHGYFSSNRIGPARLYVQIGRRLSERGCRVYRADLLGVGESDGEFCDITYQAEVRDARQVCDYAWGDSGGSNILLIGHSTGGNVALQVAQGDPRIGKAILISPAIQMRKGTDAFFSEEQLSELREGGFTYRKGLRVNAAFMMELGAVDIYKLVADGGIPFIVIQGDGDDFYDAEGPAKLATSCRNGRCIMVPGGDHNFLDPGSRERLLNLLGCLVEEE